MAKLDLETSGESGGYSDSFEIEESLSLDPLESSVESDTKNTVARKKQSSGTDTQKALPSHNRAQAKPKVTTSGLTNSIRRGSQINAAKYDDDATIDLGRTIRSPLSMTLTKRGGANTVDVGSNHGKSGSKFKHVAQNVHTMQSVVNTVKSFSDSLEVRDTVYGEWLARKTSQVSREKSSKVQARKMEDEKERQKQIELSQRSTRAVEQWNTSKEIKLREARKQKVEEMKKTKEESKESLEKRQASEIASKKWREEKTKELAKQQREKKKKEREEGKRKEEEIVEKAQSASQAFQAWSKRKEEVLKSEVEKQREHKRKLQQVKAEQRELKKEDAKRAFEAWKGRKDEKLTSTKTLYTYREDGKRKVHEKAWCPARSMRYAYPKANENDVKPNKAKKPTSERTSSRSESVEVSYSSASFESTDGESKADSFIDDENSASTPAGRMGRGSKGVQRTIQVCCQTLEYWCTCDHDV